MPYFNTMSNIIEYIPPPYQTPALILFATFPWIVVAFVAIVAWRIKVKKRHAQLAYRALEERCRCVVEAVSEAFPDLRPLRGKEFVEAVRARLMRAAVFLSSLEPKNLPELPPALRWYVNQVRSIQHHLREAEYAGADSNPAGTVLHLLNLDRSVTFPAFIFALKGSALKPARAKYGVEEMEAQFKATIGKLAMHATNVTFCDSLPKFAEDVMDVALTDRAKYILGRAHEKGFLGSHDYHTMMAIAEEKPL